MVENTVIRILAISNNLGCDYLEVLVVKTLFFGLKAFQSIPTTKKTACHLLPTVPHLSSPNEEVTARL